MRRAYHNPTKPTVCYVVIRRANPVNCLERTDGSIVLIQSRLAQRRRCAFLCLL